MATGLDLLLTTLCNATICKPVTEYSDSEYYSLGRQEDTLNHFNLLNGRHLKIGTYRNRPLSWAEKDENGTLVGRGVAFEIIHILQKKFNFTYNVVIPEKNIEMGGNKPEESLVGLVNNSLVDMAAAFLPKEDSYIRKVLFSQDLDTGVWTMLLKRPKDSSTGTGLLAPFNGVVWYTIVVAVVLYGPCITFFTRLRNRLVPDGEKYIPLSPSFWFVYGSFIKQGTNLAPEANTTRVLFTTWWIFIILLSAFYTANLTAFLTLSKFTLEIEKPQDLYEKNYRWVARQGAAVEFVVTNPDEKLYYLNQMLTSGRASFPLLKSIYDYLALVDNGAVLIKEQGGVDELLLEDYRKKASIGVPEQDRCTYVIAKNIFMTKLRGFAYPQGSKLQPLFDEVLTYVLQSGLIEFLKKKHLPRSKICPMDLHSMDRQLQNGDLTMTYVIMGIGVAISIITFLCELLIRRFTLTYDQSYKPKRKKTKFKKHPHIYTYNQSRPPSYDSIFGRSSKIKVNDTAKRKVVNGREYLVAKAPNGETRLIPMGTPSALLYKLDLKQGNQTR